MNLPRQIVITDTRQGQAVCASKYERTARIAVFDDIIYHSCCTVVSHARLVVVLNADNIFRVDGFYICRACLYTVDAQLHALVRKSFDGIVNRANHDTRNLQVL